MSRVCWCRVGMPCLLMAAMFLSGCATKAEKSSGQPAPVPANAATTPATRPAALASTVFSFNDLVARTSDIGEQRAIFRSPTATLDELEIHATTLKPGLEPHPPHQHAYEEMVILKEGTLEVMINGRKYPMTANSVIFIAPNDLHGWRNVGTIPATYWVITWRTPRSGVAR